MPLTGHLSPPPAYTARLPNAPVFSARTLRHEIAASGFLGKTVSGNEQLFAWVLVQLRDFGDCPWEQRASVQRGDAVR